MSVGICTLYCVVTSTNVEINFISLHFDAVLYIYMLLLSLLLTPVVITIALPIFRRNPLRVPVIFVCALILNHKISFRLTEKISSNALLIMKYNDKNNKKQH